MLTKKQNLIEVMTGGNPDRFVNQHEAIEQTMGRDPLAVRFGFPGYGETVNNAWGVQVTWAKGTPGPMPVHTEDTILLPNITSWRDVITAPSLDFTDEEWKPLEDLVASIDRDEQFVSISLAPGIFETLHYFQGMENALMNFAVEPEATKELMNFYGDWLIKYMELIVKRVQPDSVSQHDDFGSMTSTMFSPEMFAEFIVPVHKRVYGRYKELGIDLVVHHNDSYSATLVPGMIEMGVDIWQGPISTNHLGELIKKYGGQLTFMGGIDSSIVDREDWTRDLIESVVEERCGECGKLFFIPCTTQGGPPSTYEGVADEVSAAIDRMSAKMF